MSQNRAQLELLAQQRVENAVRAAVAIVRTSAAGFQRPRERFSDLELEHITLQAITTYVRALNLPLPPS